MKMDKIRLFTFSSGVWITTFSLDLEVGAILNIQFHFTKKDFYNHSGCGGPQAGSVQIAKCRRCVSRLHATVVRDKLTKCRKANGSLSWTRVSRDTHQTSYQFHLSKPVVINL